MTHAMTHVARPGFRLGAAVAALCSALAACGPSDTASSEAAGSDSAPGDGAPATSEVAMTVPDIQATNAFYYYRDVEAAWAFYTDVLGLETVADFGFAKIMRVAGASYLTLVDAERGMHSADEPKSVTLAIVTEQVEEWWEYLSGQGVEMRGDFNYREGQAHDGFVAIDPEGYLLEVERFNPHEENVDLMPILDAVEPITTSHGLTIQGTVFWLYYASLPPNEAFYERLLGVDLLVDQGWAKVYQASSTGFVGLVDGSRGLHQATEEKGVTISFVTGDIDAWVERVRAQGLETRSAEIGDESGRVRTFVAYDNEGYFLEWDTFLDVEGNERLMELLGGR
jgi:catechol 2,3-dioxygenase-like lactoylglutathione lyase family enzyme